ncbi:MAG: carbohydrate kinase family protein [Dehalococcoidia bacterium]|nr:carbohydrate kinase family protein [Dehalococcoidia bacterium]
MNNIQVIGLGALNMDYLYRVERILSDGEAVVKDVTTSPGGSAANTVYGLAKLGVKTGFGGVVGDDSDGQSLIQDFQSVGVDTGRVKIKKDSRSGAVLCLTDSPGKRSLYVSPGANSLLTMDDLDMDYLNQAQVLHLTSFANEAQFQISLELVARLKPSLKLSFSPGALYAVKKLHALEPILKRTHILFVNHREITQIAGKHMVAAAETCLELGCKIVVVTLGKGRKLELSTGTINAVCYIRDTGKEYGVDSHSETARQVDATGAGDAFAAGFLYGFLNGRQMLECGWLGDTIARFVIAKVGTRPGYPSLAELTKRYRELYEPL